MARLSLTPQPTPPMKSTLLTAILALTPGFSLSTFAQEKKPDVPREEHKEHAAREHHQSEAQARETVERKVKAMLEEAAKLDEAGKKDAAENLRREAHQMAHAVKAHDRAAGEGRREGDAKKADGPPRAEIEDKLKHVEQAIAHLREAGLPEPAEHLNQTANRLRAVQRSPDQPRPGEARREKPRREEGRREEPKREEPRREEARREEGRREEPRREEDRREEAKREEPRREERRPDNDVEALRREIQELRQAVRQLHEHPKR